MEKLLFSLINKSVFNDNQIELPDNLKQDDLEKLFLLSKKHDIIPIVAEALEKSGLAKNEIGQLFKKEKMVAIYRREQQNFELNRITEFLKSEKIPFIPLKGSVIKSFYPAEWMRTSADIDILIKPEDLEKADSLIKNLGYEFQLKSRHDCSYITKSGVHLELHFKISCEFDELNKIFENIWNYAVLKPCSEYEYILSPEFLLFYTIAHGKYHFAIGGCGIRMFIDYFLLKNELNYSNQEFCNLIEQGNCKAFLDGFERLSSVWFGAEQHNEFTRNMEEFILKGGVFGTKASFGETTRYLKGSKFKYYLSRIFVSRERINVMYPKSKKYPILIPFYQIKRWFRLLNKDVSKGVKEELESQSNADKVNSMMKQLGF